MTTAGGLGTYSGRTESNELSRPVPRESVLPEPFGSSSLAVFPLQHGEVGMGVAVLPR